MKAYRKCLDFLDKAACVLITVCILGIVVIMLSELIARNTVNTSFRWSTELNGFLFMWMAFIALIPLFHNNRMINLDMIYSRVPKGVQTIFWFCIRIAAILLGAAMIWSYKDMYPVLATSKFSTMQKLTKAWHYLPMAIAGGFFILDGIYQILDRICSAGKEIKK